jgi:hypothetical protein
VDPVKNRLLLWCGEMREALNKEIEKLESGTMKTHDYDQHGVGSETTKVTIARIKGWLAKLGPILDEIGKTSPPAS